MRTWVVLEGRGTGYWIDPGGNREDFELEAGDVGMIPAGYEHGSDGIGGSGANTPKQSPHMAAHRRAEWPSLLARDVTGSSW